MIKCSRTKLLGGSRISTSLYVFAKFVDIIEYEVFANFAKKTLSEIGLSTLNQTAFLRDNLL